MNRLKIYYFILAVGCLLGFGACNQAEPNAEALQFASRFASFVSQNQLDSIRAFYPGAALCDSFALRFVPDSIKLVANEQADTFRVTASDNVTFVLVKNQNGEFSVTESHGLVAFDEDCLKFAQVTGQYKDGLTDAEQSKRMSEKGFKDQLIKDFKKSLSEKVYPRKNFDEIRFPMFSADEGESAAVVYNKTGKTIEGRDYELYIYIDGQHGSGFDNLKGKDLMPGGSATFNFTYAGNSVPVSSRVVFKLSDEQLFEKYYEATGLEFDDYMRNK